jgi:hypothetical protein
MGRSEQLQPQVKPTTALAVGAHHLDVPVAAFAEVDPERTELLLHELIAAPEVQKILIEPHLKLRLHAHDAKVRFQGCHAARHDDHIHFQIQ